MRTTLLAFSLLLLLISVDLKGQSCDDLRYLEPLFDVTTTFNIEYQQARPYGSLFNQPYLLDIYEPEGDTLSQRPVIVFQFGGGYLIGDKLFPPAPTYCPMWAERGFVCVSINYRLGFSATSTGSAERAVYRGVQDLQAALRFLCEFREEYRIDTSKIIVTGNSAGAVSTLHNTFMEPYQAPPSHQGFGIGLDSYNLGGLFDSGNNYWNNQEVRAAGIICNWGAILDTNFIGDAPDDHVPTILFHGTEDNLVHYDEGAPFDSPFFPVLLGSEPMAQRLGNTTIPHKFVPLVGAAHEPELLDGAYNDTIVWESTKFMYEHVLKPQIQSVNGLTSPLLNSTTTYTVIANEPIIQVCATANNGTIVSTNQNQFEVSWTTPGLDTLQVIAGNDILAYDTAYLPISVVSLTGLEDEEEHKPSGIWPNVISGSGNLQIDAEFSAGSTVVITNTVGQLVFSKALNTNTFSIDASVLGTGLFFVRLDDVDGQSTLLGNLLVQ